MTVSEYIRKFEELSRFAAHMVGTNGLKVDRFLEGLRPELNRDVLMSGIQNMSFPEVTVNALLAEQAEVKIVWAREARNLNRNQNQKGVRVTTRTGMKIRRNGMENVMEKSRTNLI
ncbi:Uncharacterized protein Adt_06797 [Abeliophyllum distichum]|uniref:Retrotransposon gag domain-containing protein n=1 Tax=Abeliophyllum distichum TaxID=126358 RepID=A0ABD1V7X8_9LAMI